ncbi:MAG: hypothetical protein GC160_04105 [Acidobacteria bacterium]|nr:hypothetical protein [Acidobacteriota bacterium]
MEIAAGDDFLSIVDETPAERRIGSGKNQQPSAPLCVCDHSKSLGFGLMRKYLAAVVLLTPLAAWGQPLSAPTGLVASDGAYSTKVGLAWEHVRDAKLYRIFRAETDDASAAQPIGVTPSILFYDRGTAAGAVRYYWVRAENGERVSANSAPDSGFKAPGKTSNFGPLAPLEPPPAPLGNPVTAAKVYLGKTLFWDEQLSSTRTVACGTCHAPRAGTGDPRVAAGSPHVAHPGVDGTFGTADDGVGSPGVPLNGPDGSYIWEPSFGLRPQVTRRKAQSINEAAFTDQGLFWDGRAGDVFVDPVTGEPAFAEAAPLESQALETQALMPLVSEVEMGSLGGGIDAVVARVEESQPLALAPSVPPALLRWIGDRSYPELFEEAFGTPEVSAVRIGMAIASYERTLYSDQAEIDLYTSEIRAEPASVTRARDLLKTKFCDQCHRGGLLGDNRFHFLGVRPDDEDTGRAEASGRALDRGKFRTANLRNVALRAPFMHNGSLASIEAVVDFYGRGGDFDSPNKDRNFVRVLGLTEQDRADLVSFLHSLTDPRVAGEAAPLFDRPLLYAESARAPLVLDDDAAELDVTVVEPPLLGNPSFTVGVAGGPAGAEAVLVIDSSQPARGSAIPAEASFARRTVPLKASDGSPGYGSVSFALPSDPAMEGMTLYGRWYVNAGGRIQTSPAFRMTLFAPLATAPPMTLLSTVSAASLRLGVVAPASIVSGFGQELASVTAIAEELPLPTTLGDVRVSVRDSLGVERDAGLFFVSPGQINYQVPAGAASGEAAVTVFVAGRAASSGALQVAPIAPALFTANANGRGPAAAQALRVAADGSQSIEPVTAYDGALGQHVAAELDLGPAEEQLFLLLYGTGVRAHGETPVAARIGGEEAEVLFAGEQPQFVGVDQINVRIPRSLQSRGLADVVVLVGDQAANTVQIRIR